MNAWKLALERDRLLRTGRIYDGEARDMRQVRRRPTVRVT